VIVGIARRSNTGRGACLRLKFVVALTALVVVAAWGACTASAVAPAPGWTVDSVAAPTNFSAASNAKCLANLGEPIGICDAYEVSVINAGSLPSENSPITISDMLPAGLTVQKISLFWSGAARLAQVLPGFNERTDLNTELGAAVGGPLCTTTPLQCTYPSIGFPIEPDDTLQMVIYVTVDEPGAPGPLHNEARVSGGGAPDVSSSQDNAISSSPPSFGPANFNFFIAGLDGTRDTQAGGHPYELTTTIDVNSVISTQFLEGQPLPTSVQDVKDVVVDLPLGFVGSTLAAPECPLHQLSSELRCPRNTQVGHIVTEPPGGVSVNSPIWNVAPERGVPAEFGYVDADKNSHIFAAHVVPTPGGYVLEVRSTDIPQADLNHIVVTFFGNPAARDETGNAQIPFFTNPTGCASGQLTASIHMDSWQHPATFNADGTPNLSDSNWVSSQSVSPPVTGCNELQFNPALAAQPTTNTADSPSGLEFELKVPQPEDFGSHATAALNTATVTLPSGMTVDPSAGDGLQACSEAQIGWLGGTPKNFSLAPPQCPEASKIGSLELTTPLIPGVLTGAVYLAAQNENPFGSALGAYVVVDDPITGVLLKIAGEFKTDPNTGQLTTVFPENPPLPFSSLKLHFFGGPRAELATPESCGTFMTTSVLEPWSSPDSGPSASPFDSFAINSGCVSGFSPSFVAGTTNLQAGAYSPFVASFGRSDTDQELAGLTLSLPSGVIAKVAGVPLCSDADASTGACPESSRVGTVTAAAGPGPNPLTVAGKAYLTGPYKGGPYGLAVVVPAIAGPFNFGNVVVRQSLRIDPHDAHVTDVSDPFPTILNPRSANGELNGIPIRLRRVDVNIDRPGFTLNPTSCSPAKIAAMVSSVSGALAPVSNPFQVTNCASLKFAPKFTAATTGKTSKANGAGLSVKLTYPNAPFGTYANVAKVKVSLPKQLPSRLTTLQKACLAEVFDANPAKCPAESIVGQAKVLTPLLPDPLTGPAYFVSHGGEAFPDLTIVLQGDNVTVDLVGSTAIKNGVTTSTFKATPDVPFSSFELNLPQGKFSALTANADLCTSKLVMPTEFVAQNGLVLNQSTKISVTGCAKALTRAQKLAKALKACHKKKNHAKRAACESGARKQFGVKKGTKTRKAARTKPKRQR
jgi:uncharacterized repeat protein (TIGR01451 family)